MLNEMYKFGKKKRSNKLESYRKSVFGTKLRIKWQRSKGTLQGYTLCPPTTK